jgi:replication initiation protein RepC
MAQDNCAHEAPQGRHVRAPTGFRRWSPGLLKTDRVAETFAGLPEGVKSHGQLLAAFKEAAPQLGISPRLVHAVDWLFRFTQPQDWVKGARPIVWPSARMQQEALGLSPSQVKAINRRLIELGLISMKDSPNGKRYGDRDQGGKGRITEAYGFDLSPIALRHAEFVRLAQEREAERRAMRRLRRRATIARKAIIQILETAAEYSFEGEEWQILAQDMTALTRALRGVERIEEMELGVASLERRQIAAREQLEQLLGAVDSDPKGPENRPHYNSYNLSSYPQEDTVIAAKESSGGGEGSAPLRQKPEERKRPERGMEEGIAPDELLRFAPELQTHLRGRRPTWSNILDAADELRDDLGISKSLWDEACVTMNRYRAAVAIAIVSAKEPGHLRSPGGYFRGMVAKDRAQELHLDRTIWAWRRASQPQHQRGRGGGADQSAG